MTNGNASLDMKLSLDDQIIDSQSLTVAILASLIFGESIGFVGGAWLVLGVIGLLLLEVNIDVHSCKCKMLLSLGFFFQFVYFGFKYLL